MDDDQIGAIVDRGERAGDRVLTALAAGDDLHGAPALAPQVRGRIRRQLGRQRDDHLGDGRMRGERLDAPVEHGAAADLEELLRARAAEPQAPSAGRNDR